MSDISPALAKDIKDFRAALKMYAGRYEEPLFKRFRLVNGVYGQRQSGVQMIRIKVSYGRLTPAQARTLADVGEQYSTGMGHITDRQAIQYHFVDLQKIPEVFTALAKVDLTSREGCGNCVRAITGDELAGLTPDEAFNIQPVAEQVFRHFLRNPLNQNMPRKFKVAFSGSATDRALIGINDFGGIAEVRDGVKGFKLYVGGGLGALARAAYVLADWVSAEEIVDYMEAAIRVFDRHGNRKNIYRARLKFLILDLGFADFKKLFDTELAAVQADTSRKVVPIEWAADSTATGTEFDLSSADSELKAWYETNVVAQKQAGLYAVYVNCKLGNYQTDELRQLADLTEKYSVQPELRTTVRQKFLIANVDGTKLADLYTELKKLNLAAADIERAADIVSCPGSDTCLLGITKARGLTRELQKLFAEKGWEALEGLKIHVNGCPSSCGQHRIAGLGFQGASLTIDGVQLPAFEVLVGGKSAQEKTRFGTPLGKIPAHHLPTATEKLVNKWLTEKNDAEDFSDWSLRVGTESLKAELAEFTTVAADQLDTFKVDYGEDKPFKLEISSGECAGMVVSLLDVGIAEADRELYLAEQTPEEASEHLEKAVLYAAKAILIPEGLEPAEAETWSEVEKNLIAASKLDTKYTGLADKANPDNMNLIKDFLAACHELVDKAKLAIKGAAMAKSDTEFNKVVPASDEVETYDLSGVACPMNYVKTKLKLEKLPKGARLDVLLDDGEPKENVPLSVKADGHEILGVEAEGTQWRLQIRKK